MPKTEKKTEPDVVKVEPESSEDNASAITEADPPAQTAATYNGVTYPLHANGDGWPMDASIAFAEILSSEPTAIGNVKAVKHIATFLAAVLGPAGWARFRATNPQTSDMRGIYDAIIEVLFGAPSGE